MLLYYIIFIHKPLDNSTSNISKYKDTKNPEQIGIFYKNFDFTLAPIPNHSLRIMKSVISL